MGCASRGSFVLSRFSSRSDGNRGATVDTLRGTKGADFEGHGCISRGVEVGCGCFGGGSDDHKDRLILVKGPFCFVFENEKASAPLYAIGLQYMSADRKKSTVMLMSSAGKPEYELTFSDEEPADEFASAVQQQIQSAEVAQVRKDLGHSHLLNKRSSLLYAETIAKKKVQDQPEANITRSEIINNLPEPVGY